MEILVERNAAGAAGLPQRGALVIPAASTLRSLLRHGGASEADDPYIVAFVNGTRVPLDQVLHEGDRLELYSLSVGG